MDGMHTSVSVFADDEAVIVLEPLGGQPGRVWPHVLSVSDPHGIERLHLHLSDAALLKLRQALAPDTNTFLGFELLGEAGL